MKDSSHLTSDAVVCTEPGEENAAGVALPPADRVTRLQDAIEGECDGLAIDEPRARAILLYVDCVSACSFPDCECPPDSEGDVHCPSGVALPADAQPCKDCATPPVGTGRAAPVEELALLRRALERLPKSPGKDECLANLVTLERAIARGVNALDGGKANG